MTRARHTLSFLLLVPATLPLIYVGEILYPYVTPKTFLLQGLGIAALALFAYLALAGQPFFYGRLRAPAVWIPALLLLVEYVASFFGVDFYRSFWGVFERGDGLLTSTVLTALFYLVLLSVDQLFLERLVKTVAVVAGLVAGIAVLQWITGALSEQVWFLPPVTGRIGSTFGNASFLAGYLGMALFVIFLVLRDAKGLWRRLFQGAAVLSVLSIIFAATRGTILALLFVGLIVLVFGAIKGSKKWKQTARYGLAVALVLGALFIVFRFELAQSSFEPLRRVASISFSDSTVSSRLFVWSHLTVEAFKHPFLGYGAEHIAQLFDTVYDPSRIIEQWFDRSHNVFLDYFIQYGIGGLALYLTLLVSFARYALKLYRSEVPGLSNPGLLFLFLLITYAIQNFFVFDTPHSFWLLYVLFAALIILSADVPATNMPKRLPVVVPIIILVIFIFSLLFTVVRPLYANVLLTKGYLFHVIDVKRANAYFEQGLALRTDADLEYGYTAYSMYTDHQAVQLSGNERIAAYQYALTLLTKNFERYPYDARTATYLGHVLDTAPPEVVVDDVFDMQVLNRAMTLSPLRAQAWYMMANIYLRKADALTDGDTGKKNYFRKAITVLEQYAKKEPTLSTPRYILASLYYKLDDLATAKKWADEAYPLYKVFDPAAARPAVKYYLAIKDWQHAVRFLADLVADNPTDNDALYDLAKVTYLAGDPAAALRIVDEIRKSNPGLLKTDQYFLNTITAYEQSKQ